MKTLLRSCSIAFSMYSSIPMPRTEWRQEDMKYAISFFPMVGAVVGAAAALWMWLCTEKIPALLSTELSTEFSAAAGGDGFRTVLYFAGVLVACLLPVLITGGIHLDGFMDTSDALHSWRGRDEKLRILSDPHVGAFAVIRLIVFAGLYLASVLVLCLDSPMLRIWCLTFLFARALSGIAVVCFKNAKDSGTLYTFSSASDAGNGKIRNTAALAAEGAAAAVLMLRADPAAGGVTVAAALLTFAGFRRKAYRAFGGITGDIAGWFLCRCELFMAMGLAACTVFL